MLIGMQGVKEETTSFFNFRMTRVLSDAKDGSRSRFGHISRMRLVERNRGYSGAGGLSSVSMFPPMVDKNSSIASYLRGWTTVRIRCPPLKYGWPIDVTPGS